MEKEDTCCLCSTSTLKTLVLLANLTTIVSSIVAIAACIYFVWQRDSDIAELMGEIYYISTYLILLGAIITLFTGIIGFVAIIKNMKTLLIVFVVILIVILFVQLAALLLSHLLMGTLHSVSSKQLKETMLESYSSNKRSREATDSIQKRWHCCAIEKYNEWHNTSDAKFVNFVPTSCCKSETADCGKHLHPSNINHEGCLKFIEEIINGFSFYVKLLAIVVLGIEVIIIIFGILLLRRFPTSFKYRPIRRL